MVRDIAGRGAGDETNVRSIYYLSGAPRVSTRADAEASGARAHMLGVICGFENLGWQVDTYIVGDRMPLGWTGQGSQRVLNQGVSRRLAADVFRIISSRINSRRAVRSRSGNPDWIYERFGAFQSLGRSLQRMGIPWILETNGPLFHEAKAERKSMVLGGVARRLELRAYRDCDALVCISDELKGILVDIAKIPDEKVVVVPNGVDTEFYDPGRFDEERLFRGFTVGCVGNLYAWAGIDLLLEALRDLKGEGLPIYATIVGDGMMRGALEAATRDYDLTDSVVFVGRKQRDEVPPYTLGFDVGYSGQVPRQMGTMYGSPLKIYEYMAMAKPVIASAYGDARNALREDETGFLFEPGNKEDLKRAIMRAYDARTRLADMGVKAREHVCAGHSWKARVAGMVASVENILNRRRR